MIGKRLKELRLSKGYSVDALADMLYVSPFTVNSWEQDKSNPGYELLIRLCSVFGCTSDWMLGIGPFSLNEFSKDETREIRAYMEYVKWRRTHGT